MPIITVDKIEMSQSLRHETHFLPKMASLKFLFVCGVLLCVRQ